MISKLVACLIAALMPLSGHALAQATYAQPGQGMPTALPKGLQPNLAGTNFWYSQNSAPPCVLTNGATIAVNALGCAAWPPVADGVDLNTITLTQNSTFSFPTGLPTTGNFKFGLRINHGTVPYTAQFAPGYQFPSTSLSGGQPTLCTIANCLDYVWCVSEEGSPPTIVDCNTGMLAMTAITPPASFAITAHDPGTACTSVSISCNSNSITVTNGDNVVVTPIFCNTNVGSCLGSSGANSVSSITKASGTATIGTPHQMTGAAGSRAAAEFEFADVWVVPITSCGGPSTCSLVLTATFANSNNRAPQVAVFDVSGTAASSPDDGIGANASGTATPATATTGTTSQTGEFVYSVVVSQPSNSLTVSTGYTAIEQQQGSGTIPFLTQWKVSGAPGTQTFSSAINSTSWEGAIVTLKHP
jgi:hypothetical protein